MKIAVVGAGISGLGAAWLLSRRHDVAVYEAAGYLGGHAHTVDIEVDGAPVSVDTGFIVYNEANYPHLTRLFAALGVPSQASDMSFSVSLDGGRLEYEGSPAGLLAQPANALRPAYWRLLRDLVRFYREAPAVLAEPNGPPHTLGDYLRRGGYSEAFVHGHLLPMAAAIWSSPVQDVLGFPIRTFVRFFVNHGLLRIAHRPTWRTVAGGSREYVRRLSAPFRDRVRLRTPVGTVRRTPAGVFVRDETGHEARFDQLVLATHADQALRILGPDARPMERAILGAFRYQENRAVLHRDPRLLPRRRRAWASWNYIGEGAAGMDARVSVSYWMNRLQRLPCRAPIVVSLNPLRAPAPESRFGAYVYHHPLFDRAAIEAQARLPGIQGVERTWFCGSYCGYGFHEDGLAAGFGVAEALGAPAPWAAEVRAPGPAAHAVAPPRPALAAE